VVRLHPEPIRTWGYSLGGVIAKFVLEKAVGQREGLGSNVIEVILIIIYRLLVWNLIASLIQPI